MRTGLTLFTLLLTAVLLGACRAAPQIDVVGHRLGEATSEAQLVEFIVDMSNPDRVPVELRELEYRVSIDGRHVYEGRRAAQRTLQPGETVQMTVPAVIAGNVASDLQGHYQVTGSLSYIKPGAFERMLRDIGFPRSRTRFSDSDA